jgi:ankyrin repeat protein
LGLSEIVRYLLNFGAKLNVFDEFGASPMHYAAQNGHTKTLVHMIEKNQFKVNYLIDVRIEQ